MQYENITTDSHLQDFCEKISTASVIAYDTEFVSEDTFRPDLCLIQVAVDGDLAVIDTHAVEDVSPFWERLAQGEHESVVHAAREEFLFCLRTVGKRPRALLDIQLAAGLIGLEYPAAYGTLVSKLLGKTLSKGEARTDWRRRPLSQRQMDYALQDVIHLKPLRDAIYKRLDKLGRRDWLAAEMTTWQNDVEATETRYRWRRVSGISGLSPRSLAIVRELWHWRVAEAERRNIPVRRVLRDDLLVELAKRRNSEEKHICAIRGMQHGGLKRSLPELSQAIERALDLPDEECPRRTHRDTPSQLQVLGQFLATAVNSMCRRAQVAPSLVGSVQDIRDLIAYRLGMAGSENSEPPRLGQGWRAEVVGQVVDDLLRGKLSIRIEDPLSPQPLVFEASKLSGQQ